MAHWRHRAALGQADAAVFGGPVRQPRPWKFRPPAEPPRQRRERQFEDAARTALGADVIDQNELATGFRTRMKSSSVASGSGTAVMTYCATTASKDESAKAKLLASMTASVSTLQRPSARTRCCALRSIGSEISTPHNL